VLAAATFAIGLGAGATIGPVTASRNGGETSGPAPAITSAPSSEANMPRMVHSAEVVRVIDGDTFEALDITTRVRLRASTRPEFKARCTEERVKAEAARDALRAILDQGEVGISRVMLDKYGGRVVADVSTRATPNVSSALLSVGAARRYSGGHRDGWCP